MFTALVLVCSLEDANLCYTTMYSQMFATAEECKAVIEFNKLEEVFITTIEGVAYDMHDYRCVDWNSGMV